jgi:hypothetical protein
MVQDQDKELWEDEPVEKEPYEGDFPPGHEPEPKEPDWDDGGDSGPDVSDPPKWDHIDDGATCPDDPER